MPNFPFLRPTSCKSHRKELSQDLDYDSLTERLRKTLHYGAIPDSTANFHSSFSLTSVAVEKFSEHDNLFLERLCFDYASDLSREAVISPCSLVLALIYLERLSQKNPNFISSIPSSKLFLISVMVASKFLNDEGEDDEVFNPDWATSANIELTELNQLERDFLQAIDWALFVDREEFVEALGRVETRIAQREGLSRGWLTYTDIEVLTSNKLLVATWELVHSLIINVSLACLTAYLASVMTLFGSALVVSSLPWNQVKAPSSYLAPSESAKSEMLPSASSNVSTLMPDVVENGLENEFISSEAIERLPSRILTIDIPSSPAFPGTSSFYPHLSDPPFLKAENRSPPLNINFTETAIFFRPKNCGSLEPVFTRKRDFPLSLSPCLCSAGK